MYIKHLSFVNSNERITVNVFKKKVSGIPIHQPQPDNTIRKYYLILISLEAEPETKVFVQLGKLRT